MRAREILQEDYNQSLITDLTNLLIGAKGNDLGQIETNNIVTQLYNMGYSVNTTSIVPLLTQLPMVSQATPDTIELTPPEGEEIDGEDSEEKVSDMAQDATDVG